jgi:hypothetical protein
MTRRRLPALPADDVVRALERAGFRVHRIKGCIASREAITTCAIPTGLGRARWFPCTAAIWRSSGQAGLSVEEFLGFL